MPDEPTEQVESTEPVVEQQEAAEPAADAWSGVTQEEWAQTQEYLAQVGQAIPAIWQMLQNAQQPGAPEQAAPAAPEYDPFDQQSVDAYMDWKMSGALEKAFKEHLDPFKGVLGDVANERGEAMARQELQSIQTRVGDFNEDLAYVIGAGLIDRGGDPSVSLRQAAQFAKTLEDKIREDERNKVKAELQGLSEAPGEITGGAQTTEMEEVPVGRDRYDVAIRRALDRRRSVSPTG